MFMLLAEFLLVVGGLALIAWLFWRGWKKVSHEEIQESKAAVKEEIEEVLEKVELVEEISSKVIDLDLDKIREKQKRIEEVKKI
jgi:H+/Cl- antiporter ClcA